MSLPSQYQWLLEVKEPPRMIVEALKLYGVKETPGPGNNPLIMSWAKEVGLQNVYTADSIPWCGLWMAVIAKRAGKPLMAKPADMLWALNWGVKWGEDGGQPELGDVLTFIRNGGGHVALYFGEDNVYYHVIGANQSDAVNIMRIEKKRMQRCRQLYTNKPASVRPYILAPTGTVSHNEA